jgi:hypothetical protein
VDGSALKVFKYTLSGSLLGSWKIDPANTHPTGITINPSNVSDIWIVDSGTLKVYQYLGAAGRTSGSQNASATFALTAGDTNPQGIADPPSAAAVPSLADRDAVFAQLGRPSPQRPAEPAVGFLAGAVMPHADSFTPAGDGFGGQQSLAPSAPLSSGDYRETRTNARTAGPLDVALSDESATSGSSADDLLDGP